VSALLACEKRVHTPVFILRFSPVGGRCALAGPGGDNPGPGDSMRRHDGNEPHILEMRLLSPMTKRSVHAATVACKSDHTEYLADKRREGGRRRESLCPIPPWSELSRTW
jgi:hypothetical protein